MTVFNIVAAVGSGVMSGFYLGFSGVVMPGLRRIEPGSGISAMQRFNEEALKTWAPVVLATTAASVVLAVRGVRELPDRRGALLLAGSALFLASEAITVGYHVSRNIRLAGVDPDNDDGVRYWESFLPEWSTMNHARAATCAGAAVCFAAAISASS